MGLFGFVWSGYPARFVSHSMLGYGLFSVTCTSQWARVGKWVAGELVASVFSSGYRSVLCVL